MQIKPRKCNHYIYACVRGTALCCNIFDALAINHGATVFLFSFFKSLLSDKRKQTGSLMPVPSFPYYLAWTRQKSTHWLYLQAFQRFHSSTKYQRPWMLLPHNNSNVEIDLVLALKPQLSLQKTTQKQNSHLLQTSEAKLKHWWSLIFSRLVLPLCVVISTNYFFLFALLLFSHKSVSRFHLSHLNYITLA